MKETITGLQEALDKKGINIQLKPKNRSQALIRAGEVDLQIEGIKDENEKLYREERTRYYMRLKNCQFIGQLERAKRVILGFKDHKSTEDIDKEIRQKLGVKNADART